MFTLKNKLGKYKKLIVGLILLLAGVIFFHNITNYPAVGGFDYERRTDYSKIISQEFRLPTYEETSEVYDAPAFYFLSGLFARGIASLNGSEFLNALANIRFLTAALGLIAFYLWYKILVYFYPKNKSLTIFFILFLASIPVFYRVGSMIVSELLTVFNTALTFYFFIIKFLPKPTIKNSTILALLLSFGLLTRITFFSVIFAVFIGIIIYFYANKNVLRGIKLLSLISFIVLLTNGWFYLGRQQGKLLNFGTVKELHDRSPKHESIRLDFYYDIPFKLMINYPIRPYLSYPSYLLPIYYSDFWGDYWNYFAQRRFGPDEFQTAKVKRQVYSDARRKYLAWQVQVNLIPTLIMIAGFSYLFFTRLRALIKRKGDVKTISEFILTLAVIFIWGSLVAIVTKYPGGEGDWIKAPYSLLIVPIYIYSTSVFLFTWLKKYPIVYWPSLVIFLLSIMNNFIFSWF